MTSFNGLSLPSSLNQALERMNFINPTPIQEQAIPVVLTGRDLIACAQTGTGKTAAFSIPMIAKILENPKSKALIVTPTRELAAQIASVVEQITEYATHIRGALLIGGASMNTQVFQLKQNPSVVIGTPGRIVDHLERKTFDFKSFDTIVLDEADRMFDMGFTVPMERIFKSLREERQTLLFSATMSKEVVKLAQKYMKNPERVTVGSIEKPISKIKQTKIEVEGSLKNPKILEEISARSGQMLIFVRTKSRTDRLARFLKANDVKVASIHGGRTQGQRNQALAAFRAGQYPILVATDVASRGLDIPDIATVFNFDLPETAEDYIHRIGRTARAGAEGEAVSFVCPDERGHWNYLQRDKSGVPMQPNRSGGRSSRPEGKPFSKRSKARHQKNRRGKGASGERQQHAHARPDQYAKKKVGFFKKFFKKKTEAKGFKFG